MLPQQYCLRWKYHHSNLQTMFSQLLDRGCFCDVTLACEGQLIRAHRVVLCACSTFFDTVLTNYASERDPIIIMKDVTFADVKCLIEFMYKGEINVEHAHLASLLKTADDLKIKGLAEVSWREDEDGPPPPTPAAEYHSPSRPHDVYGSVHEQLHTQQHQHHRATPPPPLPLAERNERKSISPPLAPPMAGKTQSVSASASTSSRLPTLTPIPSSSSISIAAAVGAAGSSPVDHHYLGPKRKRGRPPLDDAYDVFNVRKLAQYAAHMDHQAYLESRHYAEEQHRQQQQQQQQQLQQQHQHPTTISPSAGSAAAAAYQQHIHQQQTKQRMRHRQHLPTAEHEETEHDDPQTDPEWITSNLEVNVAEDCEATVNDAGSSAEPDSDAALDIKEHKVEIEEPEISITKLEKKKPRDERSPEHREKAVAAAAKVRDRLARKHSNEEHEQQQQHHVSESSSHKKAAEPDRRMSDDEGVELAASVPQSVEEIENVQHVLEQQHLSANSTAAASVNATGAGSASVAATHKTSPQHPPPPSAAPPPPLHHPHFGKYAPDGYLLNEHGMLMTHDFVHAPTASIPTAAAASAASSSGIASAAVAAANGNHDHDFADIKMEDYDAAELRLTSEEMSQWQDVIKMDDYLAKGRRPQFWEEPFTRRVLDAIKNKRLEMKKAARILGVSYGTLYGRYREVYGCLKHPYSSTTFRPTSSNALAVQPRFDIVWPTAKRDVALLPGQLEIGKIRPKDLSELWTRPQI